MGKLLNLFKAAAIPVQRQPAWQIVGAPVDIDIVGESFHTDNLKALKRKHGDGELQIVLRPEPSNPYDSNAVVVLVDGLAVGHLARDMAREWQPMLIAAEAEGFVCIGTAQLLGGTREKPNVGVFGSAPWPGKGAPPDRWHS